MDEDEGYISRMSTDMIESPDRFTVEYDNGDFWEHNFVEPNNRLQNSLSPSLNKSLLKDVDCHTQTSCDHLDQNENLEHFYKESQLNRGIFEDKWLHPIFPQKLTFSIGRTLRVCPSDVVTSIPPSPRIALTMSVNQSTMSNPVPPAEVHPVSLTIGHLGSLSCLSPVVLLDDCKTSSLNCVRVVREVLTASQRLATGKKQATHEAKTASQKLSIGTKRGRPPKKAVESGEEPTGLEMDCTSYQFSAAVQQHTRKQTRLISNSRKSQTTNMPNVKTLSHLEPTASHMLDHDYGSTVTESHPSGTVRKRKAKKYPKKTKKQSVSPLSHIKNKKLTIHHKCISSLKLKNSQVKQKKRQVVISDSTNLNSRRSERQQNLQNRRPAHETKSTTAVSKTETRHGNSPEQNYVKISGRFQDDFVYFTAKHSRSSRRCMDILPVALTLPTTRRAPLKRTTHDFEWYHELSRIDKRLQFGSKDPCENKCSTDTEGNFEQDASNIHDINISDNCESEIVDLVMDMLPSLANPDTGGPMVTTMDTERIGGPLLLGPLLLDSSNHKVDDINSIAEQVRGMLNSLGEAELEILESRLKTDSDSSQEMCNYSYPDDVKQTLTEVLAQGADKVQNDDALCEALEQGIDGVQNNITMSEVLEEGIDEVQSDSVEVDISLLMSSQASSNPVDLEDINASDLLTTSDAVNVNSILLDLQMPISQSIIGSFPVSKQDSVLASLVQPQPNIKVEPEDLCTSSVKIEATESDLRPNLTTVSLYWNDLPALVFNDGTEYVRLIDIHRQVLPAKDTSILRKRCSILGIATTTCSDMQRDFLVRYNNAANSKSTVVITKSAADMLIGYYFKDEIKCVAGSSSVVAAHQLTESTKVGADCRTSDLRSRRFTGANVSSSSGINAIAHEKSGSGRLHTTGCQIADTRKYVNRSLKPKELNGSSKKSGSVRKSRNSRSCQAGGGSDRDHLRIKEETNNATRKGTYSVLRVPDNHQDSDDIPQRRYYTRSSHLTTDGASGVGSTTSIGVKRRKQAKISGSIPKLVSRPSASLEQDVGTMMRRNLRSSNLSDVHENRSRCKK